MDVWLCMGSYGNEGHIAQWVSDDVSYLPRVGEIIHFGNDDDSVTNYTVKQVDYRADDNGVFRAYIFVN